MFISLFIFTHYLVFSRYFDFLHYFSAYQKEFIIIIHTHFKTYFVLVKSFMEKNLTIFHDNLSKDRAYPQIWRSKVFIFHSVIFRLKQIYYMLHKRVCNFTNICEPKHSQNWPQLSLCESPKNSKYFHFLTYKKEEIQ